MIATTTKRPRNVDWPRAAAVHASVTPQAVVMGKNGELLYSGRIDDLYTALGKKRGTATQRDLREALDAITAGKRLKKRATTAIGCLIP